jgi:hypothetical protein
MYFVENQRGGSNPHDHIKSSLSASILKAHVKDGVEMAKEYKLPQEIIDIIRQHHGTTTMDYFYYQAQEKGDKDIQRSEFQYPGPRPQTKEAAIVMLADAIEAASRTLPKPTPVRVESMVKKIINNKFIESQLDECDLTLKDLNLIAERFTHMLISFFHLRVDYSEKEGASEEILSNVKNSDK